VCWYIKTQPPRWIRGIPPPPLPSSQFKPLSPWRGGIFFGKKIKRSRDEGIKGSKESRERKRQKSDTRPDATYCRWIASPPAGVRNDGGFFWRRSLAPMEKTGHGMPCPCSQRSRTTNYGHVLFMFYPSFVIRCSP
jgi:hypothetical protein